MCCESQSIRWQTIPQKSESCWLSFQVLICCQGRPKTILRIERKRHRNSGALDRGWRHRVERGNERRNRAVGRERQKERWVCGLGWATGQSILFRWYCDERLLIIKFKEMSFSHLNYFLTHFTVYEQTVFPLGIYILVKPSLSFTTSIFIPKFPAKLVVSSFLTMVSLSWLSSQFRLHSSKLQTFSL